MASGKPIDVTGSWRGRLVDVRGFEGELTLDLRAKAARITGDFRSAVGAQHETIDRQGPVKGTLDGNRLSLEMLAADGVEIAIHGTVFRLRAGGTGLKAVYKVVAAEGFSPLHGGVLVASHGTTPPSQEMGGGGGDEVQMAARPGRKGGRS